MRRALLLAFSLLAGQRAEAEIYKYKKADGTVVYTDNLSQLPPDRREYYNRQKEEREQKRREAEQTLGKEELARQEAEAQRKALEQAQLEEAERQRRVLALDETLKLLKKRSSERESQRDAWRKRMQDAQKKVSELLQAFNQAQQKVNQLGMKPSYTLLPGEAEELEKARKQLVELETALDQAIDEVEVRIPDEARRAGIPPGYLR